MLPRTQVKWVRYRDLSNTQKRVVQARYPTPWAADVRRNVTFLYRTWHGQLTQTGNDRRTVRGA